MRKQRQLFFNLLFNPSLQLVHFLVELLQALDSAQGPLLIGGRLFQRLPLVLELAELLPHQIRGGVHLADQLLTHLWSERHVSEHGADLLARQTQNSDRAPLTPQGLTVIAYMFQPGSQMLEICH